MALQEELERDGVRLFKQRSHFPLILVVLLGVELWLAPAAPLPAWAEAAWTGLCLAIAFVGEWIRAYTVGRVPGGTSARQTRAPAGGTLNTSGFYSVVRHPLYLGNFLIWAGLALLARSWRFELIVVLAFWVYYERIMYAEEAYLRRSFGAAFQEWAARTPAFLPALRQWRPPELPFSWRVVVRREHSSAFAIVVIYAAVVYARDLLAGGPVGTHAVVLAALGVSLALFLVAVYLTRRTRLLNVPGR
ncbi:MAG TPA: isoprenylcysteine carboxylmethyltransferase family protein [Longimicrobiales bacterium]|nr:isoprenylcysteine carboxylmethyltransferase family protein [Longimicrobiales bacterium]